MIYSLNYIGYLIFIIPIYYNYGMAQLFIIYMLGGGFIRHRFGCHTLILHIVIDVHASLWLLNRGQNRDNNK